MMSHDILRHRNSLLLALNIVGLTVLLVFFLGLLAVSWPVQYGSEAADLILRGRPFFPKEYDTVIFRIALITAGVLTLTAHGLLRKHLDHPAAALLLRRALAGQVISRTLMGSLIYLLAIYPAMGGLIGALKALMIVEILYLASLGWHEACWACLNYKIKQYPRVMNILKHLAMGAFAISLIWVSPARLALEAQRYGLAIDAGGIILAMSLACVYTGGIYCLLVQASSSVMLGLIALCWAMKWLLFHPGLNASFYFSPSLINLAHIVGVLFFLLLWQDRNQGKNIWLLLSLAVAVMSYKIYLPSGVFLSLSLLVYILLQNYRRWRWSLVTLASSVGAYFLLSVKPWVAFEGFPEIPFYYVLRERLFYIYAGSILLFVFYVAVVLWAFKKTHMDKGNNCAWQGALACYGLLLISNYARLPMPFHFYAALWPMIVLSIPVFNAWFIRFDLRVAAVILMIMTMAFLLGNPWLLWSISFKGLGAS